MTLWFVRLNQHALAMRERLLQMPARQRVDAEWSLDLSQQVFEATKEDRKGRQRRAAVAAICSKEPAQLVAFLTGFINATGART